MSIQFDKEIFSDGNLILKVNFTGIKNNVVNATDLKMSIYAFDSNGQPKFSESLNFDQIKGLYEHLDQISIIRESAKTFSGKFVETTEEISVLIEKLKVVDSDVLKIVLDKIKDEGKIKSLFKALSEEEIDDLSSLQKVQAWRGEIENLKKLLALEDGGKIVEKIIKFEDLKSYVAKQPEKIFQNWIEKNHLWVFGIEYIKNHDARKIAFFSDCDLLLESMDGYLDLIELKRPLLRSDIFKYDANHKCYYPSPDISEVIGQCLFYLQKMDDYKLNIEKEYKAKMLRPRIKIIAGRTKNFNEDQYNALRMLNASLKDIQIVSYDYLLSCGEKMIANYK